MSNHSLNEIPDPDYARPRSPWHWFKRQLIAVVPYFTFFSCIALSIWNPALRDGIATFAATSSAIERFLAADSDDLEATLDLDKKLFLISKLVTFQPLRSRLWIWNLPMTKLTCLSTLHAHLPHQMSRNMTHSPHMI